MLLCFLYILPTPARLPIFIMLFFEPQPAPWLHSLNVLHRAAPWTGGSKGMASILHPMDLLWSVPQSSCCLLTVGEKRIGGTSIPSCLQWCWWEKGRKRCYRHLHHFLLAFSAHPAAALGMTDPTLDPPKSTFLLLVLTLSFFWKWTERSWHAPFPPVHLQENPLMLIKIWVVRGDAGTDYGFIKMLRPSKEELHRLLFMVQ